MTEKDNGSAERDSARDGARTPKTKKKVSRGRRKARRIIAVVVIAAVLCFVALNWDWLSPVAIMQRIQASRNTQGTKLEYPLDAAQSDIITLTEMNNCGFAAAANGCYILGAKNPVFYSYSLSSPAVAVGQLDALVYESGGTQFQMYSRDGLLFSREAAASIRTAAVAKNGIYAIVTAPTEYTSLVTICSVTHTVLFTQQLTDPNITAAALSASAGSLALASVASEGGRLTALLTVYDTAQTEPLCTVSLAGEMILDMKYDREDHLCILTDRSLIFYGDDCAEIYRYTYTESLASFHLTYDGSAALLFDTGSVTAGMKLALVTKLGPTYEIAVPHSASCVGAEKDTAIYTADGVLTLVGSDGTTVGTLGCRLDTYAAAVSQGAVFYVDGSGVYRLARTEFTGDLQ